MFVAVFVVAAVAAALPAFVPHADAARLFYVSDTIGDSRPSWATNHAIEFGVPGGVPASGQIVISFQGGAFFIDPSFNYADVAFLVSTSSPSSGFVSRTLAAAPSIIDDGVTVTPTGGPITITLASGSPIPAGAYVRVQLGTGGTQIVNPSSTASYQIPINTYDAGGGAIDYGAAMVAILPAISTDVNEFSTNAPVLSNGEPTGTIPSNVLGVELSLNTNEYATCRYATSSGVAYDSMTNVFAHDSLGMFQTAVVMGVAQGTTYNYYVRCKDFFGNVDASDYLISFTAGEPTGTGSGGGTNGGPPAPPGTPSTGGGGGGFAYPAPPSNPSLVIRGIGLPGVTIAVLQDGAALPSAGTTADGNGNFSVSIPSLPQGTYSFTLIEEGSGGQAIASYTTTITVIAGTTNSITNILLPPSIAFATSTVSLGAPAALSGEAPPSSTIEIWITSQTAAQSPIEATTTADAAGVWSYALPTTGYAADTYQIKARATLPAYTASSYSAISYLGIGTAVAPRGKGDLNGDGRVNLIDFSIMLFHWGQNYPPADLNGDGVVDLPDLSILLFNWTG